MYVNSIKSVSNNIQFSGIRIPKKTTLKAQRLEDVLPPELMTKLRKEMDRLTEDVARQRASRRERLMQAAIENDKLIVIA